MPNLTKDQILNLQGQFTWFWGIDWFIETELGNFHWHDPSYGPDDAENTITKFDGTYEDFCNHLGMQFGRDKGHGIIRENCGDDFRYISDP